MLVHGRIVIDIREPSLHSLNISAREMATSILCGLVLVLSFTTVQCRLVNVTFTRTGVDYTLQTPRYPDNAPSLTNIIWQLTAPENHKIVLTCNDIRLLKRTGCSEGSLTIWDGKTQKNICNVVMNFERESEKNRMFVQFRAGWMGIGQMRCRAKALPRTFLDDLSAEDSRDHGQGVGSKSTTCPCGWTNKARIVGGKETGINEYPYIVSIITLRDKQRFCGGAIVSPYHILTAAHCIYRVNQAIGVVIGEHDFTTHEETNATKTIRVRHIIQHENYGHSHMTNDIALLVLAEKINYTMHVGPVCLPSMKYNLLHKHLKVLGWGLTTDGGKFSDVLQEVNLKVIELPKCSAKYENYIDLKNPSQICTHGNKKDSCQGDSGGPLIYHDPEINRYVQVALVSFGKECASDTPAVNIDVYFYTNWIETQINKHPPAVNTCEKVN